MHVLDALVELFVSIFPYVSDGDEGLAARSVGVSRSNDNEAERGELLAVGGVNFRCAG